MDETPKGDPIDTRLVRRLAAILKETDLTEIEIEKGDLKIRVARETMIAAAPMQYAQPQYAPAPVSMQSDPGAPPATRTAPGCPPGWSRRKFAVLACLTG